MMRLLHRAAVVALAAVSIVALSISAQGQTAPASKNAAGLYFIAGTVLNAVTGAPVQSATVALLSVDDNHRITSTLSGNDGRFSLGGLAAAKYGLVVSKRGFSTAAYDEHGEFSSAIVTGDGQDTTNLVFRLVPGAVLHGVVTGDGGDPVEGASVLLFSKPQFQEPGAKIEQAETAITDDTGTYEFDNLAKGEYLLAVTAAPWYAMQHGGGKQSAMNPALDVAFPVTYFDSTTDEASATPLALTGGSRVEADVTLHAVPALHLVVETPRKQDGSGVRPQLRQTIFGIETSDSSSGFRESNQSGTTEFTSIAPGQYELTQGDPPRVVVLDANLSQQVESGAGIPAFGLSGTLQNASRAPYSGPAVVSLEPADSAQGLKPMVSDFNKGSFSFNAVPTGKWQLDVQQSGLPVPVISITAGGRVHNGNLVTVQDRAQTIIARISADGVRVEGFAKKVEKGKAEKGAPGVMVLLIPRDPVAFPNLVRRDQSDSDGSFAIRDVAPGEYTAIALENAWDLDWTRPEAVARYLPAGIPVSVKDTRDKAVPLSGPVPVQTR